MKTRTMNHVILSLFFIMSTLQSCDKVSDSQTGEIVFWRYTSRSLRNCGGFKVEVYLNSNRIGTLNRDFGIYDNRPDLSMHYDSIPNCGDENCLTVNKPVGIYNYKAECFCISDNSKIGYWTGTLEVKQDSCTKIFFDYGEMTNQ